MSVKFDQWRKTILDDMKAVLKPLGFRKSGTTFNKLVDDYWVVINVQSSQWNMDQDPMLIYINMGVCYGKDCVRISNLKTGPKEYECHWRERLPGNKQESWLIHSDSEAAAFGRIIAQGSLERISEYSKAYPTMESIHSNFNHEGKPTSGHNDADVPLSVRLAAMSVWHDQARLKANLN